MEEQGDWQDQQVEALLAQGMPEAMPDLPYGAPPLGKGPPPLPQQLLPQRRPDAGSAGAAPIARTPAEVYNEFQRRMEYFESLKKQGVPENALPNMGYKEGDTLPVYKPPSGLPFHNPGWIQRHIEQGTSGELTAEDIQALREREIEEARRQRPNI